jgi:P-type Ca2+ transporter type 2C
LSIRTGRSAPPSVAVVHDLVPGRIRLKSRLLIRRPRIAGNLANELRRQPFVREANVNPLTGSVLLLLKTPKSSERIVGLISSLLEKLGAHPSRTEKTTPVIRGTLTAPPTVRWHALTERETLHHWETSSSQGLSPSSVQARLALYGHNVLTEVPAPSALSLFFSQFMNLPVALLLGSATLSLVTGGFADALIMMGVVFANAAIGYSTESRSRKTIRALSQMQRQEALVVRGGKVQKTCETKVVPGDLLILPFGSFVAADARLLQGDDFSVDESSLTGESLPVSKRTGALALETPLADRKNMIYRGTVVTGGNGIALVVATGAQTEIGKIQTLLTDTKTPETPLQSQLHQLGNQLVAGTCLICGGVFLAGVLRRYRPLEMLSQAISLAVAALPEGLPAIATTTLALTVLKMRKHNILVRNLDAIETLGAVEVVCFDKTGTITMNRMSVAAVQSDGVLYRASRFGFSLDDVEVPIADHFALRRISEVAALCNGSTFQGKKGGYSLTGSATEKALLQMALDAGVNVAKLRANYPVVKTQHRSENRNLMTTLHGTAKEISLKAMKGSPSEVLALCRWQWKDGKFVEISARDRRTFAWENDRLAEEAFRVLGFAYQDEAEAPGAGFVWLGLVGMRDPVRGGVKELVQKFHRAGIETVMLTGDQRATAQAIAMELGLSGNDPLLVVDSTHLDKKDFSVDARQPHVFSRVSPLHKLQIVQRLQKSGRIVAMTGDGINDGPALKAADIGIAMGAGGTEMAREVGDLVLKDDDLSTLLPAIEQGRATYDNIRKAIHYILATNLSEVLLVSGAITGGLGPPLSSLQLLWINLVTDVFPALALAVEPPAPDTLERPPRNPREPLLNRKDARHIGVEASFMATGALGFYLYGLSRYGQGPQARALAFTNLTASQLLHAWSSRTEYNKRGQGGQTPRNPYLSLAVGVGFALQAASLFVPGIRTLLGTRGVRWQDLLLCEGGALINFLMNSLWRQQRDPSSIATKARAENEALPVRSSAPDQSDQRNLAPSSRRLTTRRGSMIFQS